MNVSMIYEVMERITDENLNMNSWAVSLEPKMSCGTTMCLAGHTVVAAGYALRWAYNEDDGEFYADRTKDDRDIELLASELLGITRAQASDLFYAFEVETVDELWDVVTRVTGVQRPAVVAA